MPPRSKPASPSGDRNTRVRVRKGSIAASVDLYDLYQRAVQDTGEDVVFFDKTFKKLRGRRALTLREDFAGTALLSADWVTSARDRRAVACDLDLEPLEWGRRHNLEPRGADVVERTTLLHANVLDGRGPKTDIACALNFSYCCIKRRADLLQYYKHVRRKLNDDGLFFTDVYGGTEVMLGDESEKALDDAIYRWEQTDFDPLTHDTRCYIHFEFPDGSALSPAFSYEWRLWTAPELRDLLHEAGFSRVRTYWEREIDSGVFYEPKPGTVENQASWWTFMVAER